MSQMQHDEEDAIMAVAAHWHEASQSDAMDWDAFTHWLEQDPRHWRAYDAVALAESLLDEAALDAASRRPPESPPASRGRHAPWRWIGSGLAAAASIALALTLTNPERVETYETDSQARQIALVDGSRIDLAPHSKLSITGSDRIALNGDALFTIRHDPSRTLTVSAGSVEVTDIGTIFEMKTGADETRVSVAEGKVSVAIAQTASPTQLHAGQSLVSDRTGNATVAATPVKGVGAWTKGQLSYEDAPLSLVAQDLGRYAGVRVEISPDIAAMRFSGTLATDNGIAAVEDLAGIMGLALHRDGHRVRLSRLKP